MSDFNPCSFNSLPHQLNKIQQITSEDDFWEHCETILQFLVYVNKLYTTLRNVTEYFQKTEQKVKNLQTYYKDRDVDIKNIHEYLTLMLSALNCDLGFSNSVFCDEIVIYEQKVNRYNNELITVGTTQVDQVLTLQNLCCNQIPHCSYMTALLQECVAFVKMQSKRLEQSQSKFSYLRRQLCDDLQIVQSFESILTNQTYSFKKMRIDMETNLHLNYDRLCDTFHTIGEIKTIIAERQSKNLVAK